MALNVVMVGASRSGKTSILASMLNNVRDNQQVNGVNECFFVRDISEYNAITDLNVREQVNLQENVDGMRDLSSGNPHLPKMTNLFGTSVQFTYNFEVTARIDNNLQSDQMLSINFHDVPGEWWGNDVNRTLDNEIKNAQLLIVAVDVPSLMYAKETGMSSLNTVMNCPEQVRDAVEMLGSSCYSEITDEEERNEKLKELLRMVIFVPIKCEYWLQKEKKQEIYDEIYRVYGTTIDKCRQYDNMQVLVLPVETIGSCLFDHHSIEDNSLILKYATEPSSRFYIREDIIDNHSTVRCERMNDSQVRLKNGVIYDLREGDELILARARRRHPYCYDGGSKLIPYAWFRPTGGEYAPRYCDLLFYQVLKFSIMDFAKRTGNSARSVFDDVTGFWSTLRRIPAFISSWLGGARTPYASVEQVRLFQQKISEIKIDETIMTYIVNRENGTDTEIQ